MLLHQGGTALVQGELDSEGPSRDPPTLGFRRPMKNGSSGVRSLPGYATHSSPRRAMLERSVRAFWALAALLPARKGLSGPWVGAAWVVEGEFRWRRLAYSPPPPRLLRNRTVVVGCDAFRPR